MATCANRNILSPGIDHEETSNPYQTHLNLIDN